ncbi:Methyltransf-25 domain-containing protein [Fusarium keratoplasticum]|uniref:Methyltransf-25 domain-containing protein n=1 Tax=Fusarium keratoplasticum TaxID=1328300 RepID=A0ACC0R5W7_9HYPO|nr:Methyltransf-25 domain-containing protein [Fusarium keratoplasticum]KAI8675573.1 Methyltransf-25 domain-containing protein [Fusarium keratoplasticum]KAI8682038.1 Methyltransf-25 domain-containing protein [Fusarium keratoplasticum]
MSGIQRVLNLSSSAEAKAAYDDWAENYDNDMLGESEDYVAPEIASDYVKRYLGSRPIGHARILDAGCGTGLVGASLAKKGAKHIDGIDLSPGMLQVAERSGAYETLSVANLSQRLDIPDQTYDVVACVGTMTQGHVGPEAFDEFARIVKPGGFILSTVRDTFWKMNGYEDKVKSLDKAGKLKLMSAELEEYRRGAGVQAVMVVLQAQ